LIALRLDESYGLRPIQITKSALALELTLETQALNKLQAQLILIKTHVDKNTLTLYTNAVLK